MNDTTPTIGPIRGIKPQVLLKINGHTIVVHKGNVLQQCEEGSWKEETHEKEQLCFEENSTTTHIDYKEGNCLSTKENSSCTDHQEDHQ